MRNESTADSATGALRSVRWTGSAILVRQALLLLTVAILARILPAEDFGVMAMAMTILGFAMLFRDAGIGASLVQRRIVSEGLVSSQFWLVLALGMSLSVMIFAIAPLLASMFREPGIEPVARGIAPVVALSAFGAVPQALLERQLEFSRVALSEILAAAGGSAVAVVLALLGGGVWSLVAQALVMAALGSFLLMVGARFRPRLRFSPAEARTGFHYGSGLSAFNVANYVTRNADYFVVGRVLGATQLGYYSMAYRLMSVPAQTVTGAFNRVLFPLLSRAQDDIRESQGVYLSGAGAVAFTALPVSVAVVALAERIVTVLLGPGWEEAIPVLQVLAIVGASQTIAATAGPVWMARGAVTEMAAYGIVSGLALVAAFIVGAQSGILGVAVAYMAVSLGLFLPSMWLSLRHIELGLVDLARVLARPLLIAVIAALPAMAVDRLAADRSALALVSGLAVGAGVYLATSSRLNRAQMVAVISLASIDAWPLPRRLRIFDRWRP